MRDEKLNYCTGHKDSHHWLSWPDPIFGTLKATSFKEAAAVCMADISIVLHEFRLQDYIINVTVYTTNGMCTKFLDSEIAINSKQEMVWSLKQCKTITDNSRIKYFLVCEVNINMIIHRKLYKM